MKNNYRNRKDIAIAREIIACPGDTLVEHLECTGMTQAELADRMGRPKKTINEIIRGKAQIMPETALQLERVIGIPASFWINKEQNYRLRLAEINEAEKRLDEADRIRMFPLKEMIKKGWITCEKGLDEKNALLSFFRVASLDAYERVCHKQLYASAYRMSEKSSKDPYAMSAWLRQGERQSESLQAAAYDKKAFEQALLDIRTRLVVKDEGFLSELQGSCLQAGVKVVFTPCLQKAPLNGSTRWMNDTPLIQLSDRFKRNDIFWFTFFHEAAHILKHNKGDLFIEGLDYSCDGKKKEAEADAFAEECLISRKDEKLLLKHRPYEKEDIERFAKKIGTHPAVVAGRLANKGLIKHSLGRFYGFYKNVELKG
ncbi:HigA family addiction module antidote protein [Prosthecochloris sp. N3]|uniref:HigA family addiction module antidote protein n=1 Tax=Prosthecochloris ethylica TaxID=2743976 RepID=A0ABR9XSG7_9CHLB|nr:HigA family addiction module antitoxin [Prosthecochloris ethylica]MBF0585321.1 HigA family addiction module antidote protein [Prosthecochloris ethylica]MBF0636857.1 HigA family addiction module antidote protein [Prosthecochloris ethylica]NUK46550.1 HigA family addiction module antidote protein [Prosthecochloris ethylica]